MTSKRHIRERVIRVEQQRVARRLAPLWSHFKEKLHNDRTLPLRNAAHGRRKSYRWSEPAAFILIDSQWPPRLRCQKSCISKKNCSVQWHSYSGNACFLPVMHKHRFPASLIWTCAPCFHVCRGRSHVNSLHQHHMTNSKYLGWFLTLQPS